MIILEKWKEKWRGDLKKLLDGAYEEKASAY